MKTCLGVQYAHVLYRLHALALGHWRYHILWHQTQSRFARAETSGLLLQRRLPLVAYGGCDVKRGASTAQCDTPARHRKVPTNLCRCSHLLTSISVMRHRKFETESQIIKLRCVPPMNAFPGSESWAGVFIS